MRSESVRRRSSDPSGLLHQPTPKDVNEKGLPNRPGVPNELRNEVEFSQWYYCIEDDLLEASYEEYQSYLEELQTSKSHLDTLLADTLSTLNLLSNLSESFNTVESQTSALRKQCEGLLTAQRRNSELADNIRDNLQYYDFLDPASRRLNAPGAGRTVRSKEFSNMLKRLDECLDYMEAHPEQMEAELYRSRYRLLLTRALTLIRGHFVETLRDISAGVSKRIADRQLNDTTMSALLYVKFRVGASELKEMGLEIQKRVVPPLDPERGSEAEYQSLMNDLYSNYSRTRARLLIPLMRKKLNDIAQAPSTSKDVVAFARASIGYIRGICLDEFELWHEWFHNQTGLYDYLEAICEPVYDHLRPRIIHEDKLIKLCQLCTLLQTRYLSDPEEETEYTDPSQLDFSILIQPALEDAQTRLVFRAQAILRDQIERYKPQPEDIDYPARNHQTLILQASSLSSARKNSSSNSELTLPKTPKVVDEDLGSPTESDRLWNLDSQGAYEGWYPTLRKAIWLLSRIYRLVNSTVFDDLAHQIVHQTNLSLHQAGAQISNKSSTIDGQLFLIKHLLTLKQQIVAFDIEYVTPDVSLDFSGVTNTFWELRGRGGLFNPQNLMQLVGRGLLPRVVENMMDAKVELDGRLRTVINDFTNNCATRMTASLSTKIVEKRNMDARKLMSSTCENIGKEVLALRKALNDYLADTRTKETLVGAVQDRVIQLYEDFFENCESLEKSRGGLTDKRSKEHENVIWDVDTFVEWSDNIFRVGLAVIQSSNDEGGENISGSRSASRSSSIYILPSK